VSAACLPIDLRRSASTGSLCVPSTSSATDGRRWCLEPCRALVQGCGELGVDHGFLLLLRCRAECLTLDRPAGWCGVVARDERSCLAMPSDRGEAVQSAELRQAPLVRLAASFDADLVLPPATGMRGLRCSAAIRLCLGRGLQFGQPHLPGHVHEHMPRGNRPVETSPRMTRCCSRFMSGSWRWSCRIADKPGRSRTSNSAARKHLHVLARCAPRSLDGQLTGMQRCPPDGRKSFLCADIRPRRSDATCPTNSG
jgi:hypothetical protein